MLNLVLKHQLRNGEAYFMVIFMISCLLEITFQFNLVFLPFIILYPYFVKDFSKSLIEINLLRITNCNLGRYIKSNNITTIIWSNLFVIAGVICKFIIGDAVLYDELMYLFIISILLFTSIIIGNIITNSDIVTIRSSFWKHTLSILVYQSTVGFMYLMSNLALIIPYSVWLLSSMLIILIIIWWYNLKSYKTIIYYKYLLI